MILKKPYKVNFDEIVWKYISYRSFLDKFLGFSFNISYVLRRCQCVFSSFAILCLKEDNSLVKIKIIVIFITVIIIIIT